VPGRVAINLVGHRVTVAAGRIVEIDALTDPERLMRLDLRVLDD
jgi:hypothetical protein